ncbi:sigma-70 family RNA polymerase sigma factor [Glaciihabitans sp. UYNi722]|uniref:sigma-70 family RNA polymerase sigma factor n=1 Tax=Glaciihabitans sp. UYNi722 TaxID=3156344 RepID=UPI003396FE43
MKRTHDDYTQADTLLERVAEGDQAAFAELFDELAPRVLRRIVSVLRDQAMSEEVMQDVFLETWQNAARYDVSKGGAAGWILARAHARAVDRVRSAQAERDRDLKVGMRDYAPELDSIPETVELQIESDRVNTALEVLSEVQRQAVVLSFYRGYSHSQMAEMLHVPIGTVKSRVHDGLRHLREELDVAS